ncbi:MAG: RNA 2'-phosphotransferase [Planctomycetales bacterium]
MNHVQLSKKISLVLRHEPWLYELELDPKGWTSLEDLLEGLRSEKKEWEQVSLEDIQQILASADKQRFELRKGQIRALYGHSFAEKIVRTKSTPPEFLFHGTSPAALDAINGKGLLPMNRQYVHLSVDRETATLVGKRKSKTPVMLCVDAQAADSSGISFYRGNDNVWLTDHIPPQFITQE